MDENLDKLVPISNQPEEKIKEIIDMSSEQYPEFESKVRKRIREYLKHCRRTQNKNNSHKIERNSNHPDSENIEEDDKEALVNRMVIMEFFSMIAIIAFFIAISAFVFAIILYIYYRIIPKTTFLRMVIIISAQNVLKVLPCQIHSKNI